MPRNANNQRYFRENDDSFSDQGDDASNRSTSINYQESNNEYAGADARYGKFYEWGNLNVGDLRLKSQMEALRGSNKKQDSSGLEYNASVDRGSNNRSVFASRAAQGVVNLQRDYYIDLLGNYQRKAFNLSQQSFSDSQPGSNSARLNKAEHGSMEDQDFDDGGYKSISIRYDSKVAHEKNKGAILEDILDRSIDQSVAEKARYDQVDSTPLTDENSSTFQCDADSKNITVSGSEHGVLQSDVASEKSRVSSASNQNRFFGGLPNNGVKNLIKYDKKAALSSNFGSGLNQRLAPNDDVPMIFPGHP